MVEFYFDVHSFVKRNVLQGLINLAKVAYVNSDKEYLNYVLDDMSYEMLQLDINLLDESTFGLFMEDSSMSEEIKQTIQQLAHAAMQNQKIELSDVLKVIKQDSIQEAEEALLVSEELREKRLQEMEQQKQKAQQDMEAKQREHEKESWQHEADMIVLKEEERRKTEIQKQTILSIGFDVNKDQDDDGVPDVLEIAKHGVDAEIKRAQIANESRRISHEIENDKEKNQLERQKIAKMSQKSK